MRNIFRGLQTFDIPETSCPSCGLTLCGATDFTNTDRADPPTPGSTTICYGCYVFLIVTDEMAFRMMSNAEWEALPQLHKVALTTVRERLRAETVVTER